MFAGNMEMFALCFLRELHLDPLQTLYLILSRAAAVSQVIATE